MSTLSRAAILAADDFRTERLHVKEWGGDVIVRGMTVRERDSFEASIQKPRRKGDSGPVQIEIDSDNLRAKLAVRCIVNENGERLFSDDDAEVLGAKSAAAVARVADVAQRLCGMSRQDLEDLAGNSAATGVSEHATGSPPSSDVQSLN